MSTSSQMSTLITDQASISGFNRGPITTVFEPPASCLSTLTLDTRKNVLYPIHGVYGYFDDDCFPLGTLRSGDLHRTQAWGTYYSKYRHLCSEARSPRDIYVIAFLILGFLDSPAICPLGWETAATFSSALPVLKADIELGSETSAILCCPP